jgi:hypothetical protein
MPHKYTMEPLKKAQDIRLDKILKDGLLIDWDNQFEFKTVVSPITQDKLNEAVKQHCKFIVCRDVIHSNHKIYGEKSYYINLGITANPSSDFTIFQLYAQKSTEFNIGSHYLEYMEKGYRKLCKKNNVIGELGSLFE